MSIRISSVSVTPNITTVGQPVVIKISADEIFWNNLKKEFVDWEDVKNCFTNWRKIKDWQPTTSNENSILGTAKLGDFYIK